MLKIQLILNISVAVMSWKCCPLYVDNQSLLSSSRGERFVPPFILIVHVISDCLLRISVTQCHRYVLTYEEGLALLVGHCPDFFVIIIMYLSI